MTAGNIIAVRYASALYKAASIAKVEKQVLAELRLIHNLISADSKKFKALTSEILPMKQQKALWDKILQSVKLEPITLGFFATILKHNRAHILTSAINNFEKEINKAQGVVAVKVTSAIALSAQHIDALTKSVKSALNSEISMTAQVDHRIQGGLTIEVGTKMLDLSVRARLEQVKQIIKAVTV